MKEFTTTDITDMTDAELDALLGTEEPAEPAYVVVKTKRIENEWAFIVLARSTEYRLSCKEAAARGARLFRTTGAPDVGETFPIDEKADHLGEEITVV